MSLYDKASLVQIPSGTKAGTLYSVLPANGDGDFTHTRATSATRVNKDGLIESVASGVPRLDYPLIDGVVQDCPALLLEPIRSNKIAYSEGFNNWASVFTAVSLNEIVSPDGGVNATKLTDTSDSSTHRIQIGNTTSSSGSFFYSIFLKKGTLTTVALSVYSGANAADSKFDLDNGSIVSTTNGTAEIQEYGNDWYRCIVKGTLASTSTTTYIYLKEKESYSGSSQFLYAWGGQLEEGSYPTSYIPTSGSAVTRNADFCIDAGTSAEFNTSEGVLFVESAALADDLTFRQVTLNDSGSNTILVGYRTNSNRIYTQLVSNSVSQAFLSYDVSDITEFHKFCIKYSTNSVHFWVDGYKRASETSATMPLALTDLDFQSTTGSAQFYAKTKQVMVFNEALTDSELEQITSWTSFGEMAKGQLYTIE